MTDEASKTAQALAVFKTAVPSEIRLIATEKLRFDQQNPRFYRLNDASSVDAIVEEMLDDESAQDLMLSIGSKGYFPGEPLLVTPDGNGTFIVVEGNRRLAATKLLNGQLEPPQRRSASVQRLREASATAPPTELPCIVYAERRDVLRYLGYRHITGVNSK